GRACANGEAAPTFIGTGGVYVDAREGSCREGEGGPPRGQVAQHGRGRVRSRGDRARPGGQARCPLRQAGHRHRVVQGAPRGGPPQATEEGADVEQDPALGKAGVRGWTEEAEAEVPVAPARSGRLAGAEARATPLGLTVRALAAGQERGTAPASVSAPCHASLEGRSRCGSAGRPR